MTTFIGQSFAEDEHGVYYHGFKKSGTSFSALHYVIFNEEKSNEQFVGKIQSIFHDKQLDMKRAEVSVFQYVPDDQKRTNDEIYNELWMVMDETIEIPLDSIEGKEVSVCHVPANINDSKLIEYVDTNIGKTEHEEDLDSDYESDDDMSDFIIKGEICGFYQYAVKGDGEEVHYAPPPKFGDKYMSFQTTEMEERLTHEFVEHIKYKYICPKLDCFKDKTPFTDEDIINKLLMQEYVFARKKFYFGVTEQEVEMNCNINKTKVLTAFVFLLKTMLTSADVPCLSDMYNFCLKFEMNV